MTPFSDRSRSIEILESRIAPATLVSPTSVTFTSKNGDLITVTISEPLFTMANVNKVFAFDTGTVDGSNTAQQQLQTLNITKLGSAAHGMNLSITGGEGGNAVGFINSSLNDLGDVTVEGDLGRISAGDFNFSSPALHSLTVDTLGAQGLASQAAGGNLNSLISGSVGSFTVHHDIDGASVGVGGGSHGTIGKLIIGGSLVGGSTSFSGSIRTQGGITSVEVDGSITGGSGNSSGVIGTAGVLGTVLVKGDVTGGGGTFSGAILSRKGMTSVEIDGNLIGGGGADSGQVGTDGTLAKVTVDGSVFGGDGFLSGTILARHDLTQVTIANSLEGGSGASSGQVGAGRNIGSITIGAGVDLEPTSTGIHSLGEDPTGIQGGSGPNSGAIIAGGSITTVDIEGSVQGSINFGFVSQSRPQTGIGSATISAHGDIATVTITENVDGGSILSKGSIGRVEIDGSMTDQSEIHAGINIGSVFIHPIEEGITAPGANGLSPQFTSNGAGLVNSSIFADAGSIDSIAVGAFGAGNSAIDSSFIAAGKNIGAIQGAALGNGPGAYGIVGTEIAAGGTIYQIIGSSSDDSGICATTVHAGKAINSIDGESFTDGEDAVGVGILNSHFQAGSIGMISAGTEDSQDAGAAAISGSAFNASGNIGAINVTGGITGSLFVAGIKLASGFDAAGAGGFDNSTAAGFGFGKGSVGSSAAAHIGAITLNSGEGEVTAMISNSTFLAGVKGPGKDGRYGTKDDVVTKGSSVGDISADSIATVFVEAGSIGATTVQTQIAGTTYIATDSAATAAGIGAITVGGFDDLVRLHPLSSLPPGNGISVASGGILDSTFISNAGIGAIQVEVDGVTSDTVAAIAGSTFLAGHQISSITVFNDIDNEGGTNYGIESSTFKAGISGAGGIGAIRVHCSQESSEDGATNYGISDSTFDASAGSGHTGSIGFITVTNDLDNDGDLPIGIDHSVFRAHGNIGDITVTLSDDSASAVQDSTFSAFGSLGNIAITGSVEVNTDTSSHFLAGYDIGPDLTFGNENLGAHSAALNAGQRVGNVTVTGDFLNSDIAASINPGAGYLFGDSSVEGGAANDSFVGSGGTIGLVQISTGLQDASISFDHATNDGIEAKTFLDGDTAINTFTYGVNTGGIPAVLFYGEGGGEVRVSNLTVQQDT